MDNFEFGSFAQLLKSRREIELTGWNLRARESRERAFGLIPCSQTSDMGIIADVSSRRECVSRSFFWLPAARVRVPGGLPFSQLQQREKDHSTFLKSNKNIHFFSCIAERARGMVGQLSRNAKAKKVNLKLLAGGFPPA